MQEHIAKPLLAAMLERTPEHMLELIQELIPAIGQEFTLVTMQERMLVNMVVHLVEHLQDHTVV
jgi:hypothetical protein